MITFFQSLRTVIFREKNRLSFTKEKSYFSRRRIARQKVNIKCCYVLTSQGSNLEEVNVASGLDMGCSEIVYNKNYVKTGCLKIVDFYMFLLAIFYIFLVFFMKRQMLIKDRSKNGKGNT